MPTNISPTNPPAPQPPTPAAPPELFQIVIECESEAQQREWFERLRREGFQVRLLVL